VQIRQAAKGQLQVPFARGKIDLAAVIEGLRAADYTGLICVEYLQTAGWHGLVEVNAIRESVQMRDALREARDRPPTPPPA
jgi:sugar phosphate isomerase/epimerase